MKMAKIRGELQEGHFLAIINCFTTPSNEGTMVQNRVILRHLAKIDFSPSALGLSHGLGWYLGHMEWSIKVTGTLHLFRQVLVFDH